MAREGKPGRKLDWSRNGTIIPTNRSGVRCRAVALKKFLSGVRSKGCDSRVHKRGTKNMKRNIYRGIYANTVVLGGKIVIVGFDYAVTEFRVARYNPDGTRDTTFPETKQ